MADHVVTVAACAPDDVDGYKTNPFGAFWRATCECGWRSATVIGRSRAQVRAAEHAEATTGVVPPGRYAQGARSPIVAVFLCAACAGFAPISTPDYEGALSGRCGGCDIYSRELHRFRAWIDTACGCRCSHGHDQVVGDMWAIDNAERSQDRAGVGENAEALDAR